MELSSSKIKKFLIFPEMELSSLIFQEATFRARKIKKARCEKVSYISGNRTF